jgi:hypothetical protein
MNWTSADIAAHYRNQGNEPPSGFADAAALRLRRVANNQEEETIMGAVRPEDYGIAATDAVLAVMARQDDDRNARWLADISACGPWELWEFSEEPKRIAGNIVVRKFSRARRLHIGRQGHRESNLIVTLCGFQLHKGYGYAVKAQMNATVCGHCLNAARMRGIELGSKQPNIKGERLRPAAGKEEESL